MAVFLHPIPFLKSGFSIYTVVSKSAFNASAGILSGPASLPLFSFCTDFRISSLLDVSQLFGRLFPVVYPEGLLVAACSAALQSILPIDWVGPPLSRWCCFLYLLLGFLAWCICLTAFWWCHKAVSCFRFLLYLPPSAQVFWCSSACQTWCFFSLFCGHCCFLFGP